jgi:hypothetical protein
LSDTNQPLDAKVADWLEKQGYRLEYLTESAFRGAGLHAVLGEYVEDVAGQKPREIDVSVFRQLEDAGQTIYARCICECKYSKKKQPWVLLHSGLYSAVLADWWALPKSPGLHSLSASIEAHGKELRKAWHFADGRSFAHTIVEAFRDDNRDTAYDALCKITHAAWDKAEAPSRQGGRGELFHVLVLPCLVVDAPLYHARFDSAAGRFVVKETKFGRLSWSGCRNGTAVDVVHVDALPRYAAVVKETFEVLLSVARKLVNHLPGSGHPPGPPSAEGSGEAD